MNEKLFNQLEAISGVVEQWLDYQEVEYLKEGIVVTDETYVRTFPKYPLRGQLWNWIEVFKEAQKLATNE